MKRFFLVGLIFAALLFAAAINGFLDVPLLSTPANPAAGNIRLYGVTSTGKLGCLSSAGADCMPSGGGGGSAPTVDTFANIVASAPADGTIGIPTNSFYTMLVRSAGAWRYFMLGREMFPAVPGSFTLDNAADTTTTTTTGSITMGSAANTLQLTAYYAAIPGATFTTTAHILYHGAAGGNGYCFLGVGDTGGAYTVLALDPSNDLLYQVRWNSSTSFGGGGVFGGIANLMSSDSARGSWLRISEGGGTRAYQVSGDGNEWRTVGTEATGTFLTTARYAFGLNRAGAFSRACTFTTVEAN